MKSHVVIRKVLSEDISIIVSQLRLSLLSWLKYDSGNLLLDLPDYKDKVPKVFSILNEIKMLSSVGQEHDYYVSFFQDVPVGILVVKKPCINAAIRSLEIKYLVTHQATTSGGVLLVEYAVNLSKASDYDEVGKITLRSINHTSGFYEKLGFVNLGSNFYELNIHTSPYWNQDNGTWHYSRFQ